MFRRCPTAFLLVCLAASLMLVSCGKQDDATPRLLQQLAILGDEIRTANREIKLLRQEVSELRQQAGLVSTQVVESGTVAGGACVGEGGQCRPSGAEAAAEFKPGAPPPRDGVRNRASKPQAASGGNEGREEPS